MRQPQRQTQGNRKANHPNFDDRYESRPQREPSREEAEMDDRDYHHGISSRLGSDEGLQLQADRGPQWSRRSSRHDEWDYPREASLNNNSRVDRAEWNQEIDRDIAPQQLRNRRPGRGYPTQY